MPAPHVHERHVRIEARECARDGQREVVREVRVYLLRHARRGYAKAEEAGVESRELVLDGCDVEEVGVDHLFQLGVLLAGGAPAERGDAIDVARQEALAEHSLTYHS